MSCVTSCRTALDSKFSFNQSLHNTSNAVLTQVNYNRALSRHTIKSTVVFERQTIIQSRHIQYKDNVEKN